MNPSHHIIKKVGELTFSDFLDNPIWGFNDDDGDEVEPVNYPGHLIWPEGGSGLFVASTLTLKDQTTLSGIICVHMSTQGVYALEFPDVDGKLISYAIGFPGEGSMSLSELALRLGKPIDAVSSITYTTPYVFENGQALTGTCELKK